MSLEYILIWIIVGAIAGWIASLVVRGVGLGLLGSIAVGILGAFIGGWIFDALDVSAGAGWLGAIVTAAIGAIVLLLIVRLVR